MTGLHLEELVHCWCWNTSQSIYLNLIDLHLSIHVYNVILKMNRSTMHFILIFLKLTVKTIHKCIVWLFLWNISLKKINCKTFIWRIIGFGQKHFIKYIMIYVYHINNLKYTNNIPAKFLCYLLFQLNQIY